MPRQLETIQRTGSTQSKATTAKTGKNHPKYGKHLSKATRLKISKALAGRKCKPFTAAHRKNISNGLKGEKGYWYGKHFSTAHCRKIGEKHAGKVVSKASRKKMSIAKSGKNHPLWNKHHSKATCKKLSEAKTGKNHPMWNKHHSIAARKKMSKAKKGKNHPTWKKSHSEAVRKKRIKSLAYKPLRRRGI